MSLTGKRKGNESPEKSPVCKQAKEEESSKVCPENKFVPTESEKDENSPTEVDQGQTIIIKETSVEIAPTEVEKGPTVLKIESVGKDENAATKVGEGEVIIKIEVPAKEEASDYECATALEEYEFFLRAESPFSQSHKCEFVVDGVKFCCTEQYMMYAKAILFGDKKMANQIIKETIPKKMKGLGRKVSNFDEEVWHQERERIVRRGNIEKFSQNEHLRKRLISTHPRILVEASPSDCIWGIGLASNDPNAFSRKTWRGQNLLGFILTSVREKLMLEDRGYFR